MSLRPLFAMLIAVGMLFAPLAMQSGRAMAMAPAADHHAQMMESGHCEGQSDSGKDSKSAGKPCCAAMCAAIAVAPVSPAESVAFARLINRPSLQQFRHGFLAKLPTPPPRRG